MVSLVCSSHAGLVMSFLFTWSQFLHQFVILTWSFTLDSGQWVSDWDKFTYQTDRRWDIGIVKCRHDTCDVQSVQLECQEW